MDERNSCARELSTPEGNVGAATSRQELAAFLTRTSSSSKRTESQSNSSSDRCSATVGRTSRAATFTSTSSSSSACRRLACARSAQTPLRRPRPWIPSTLPRMCLPPFQSTLRTSFAPVERSRICWRVHSIHGPMRSFLLVFRVCRRPVAMGSPVRGSRAIYSRTMSPINGCILPVIMNLHSYRSGYASAILKNGMR